MPQTHTLNGTCVKGIMMIFFVGKNQGNASEPRKIPSSPAPPSIPKEDSGRTTQALLPRHYLEDYPAALPIY